MTGMTAGAGHAVGAADFSIWAIAAITTACVLIRPFKWPEAVWAIAGAALVLLFGLMPFGDGLAAIGKGADVYLFLVGMMLLSETARQQGLFDWVAAAAVNHARGSPRRLFTLVYGIGVVVTTFLSNDAAAVVLTPAVLAASRKAKADALPYLFICAFIANAASFVLPISNPANLVMYGDHVPRLLDWLRRFTVPSVLAIAGTYVALRLTQAAALQGECEASVTQPPMTSGCWTALAGLVGTAVALLVVSALDQPLGLPTCVLGVLTAVAVLLRDRSSPWALVKGVSWSVLPLVAGLFVLVEALNTTGVVGLLATALRNGADGGIATTAAVSATLIAFGSNLVNNLPAGLIASTAIAQARPPQVVVDALLIGVDLGPNLSITGSLATILWLTTLRRDSEDVSFWRFLKVGVVVMPPALMLAIGGQLLMAGIAI